MEDSNRPSSSSDAEGVYNRIGRRELLIGATFFGGVAILSDSSEDDKYLDESEASLAQLATTVDEADLTDPREMPRLSEDVSRVVASVRDTLNQDSPGTPEAERRVSTINSVLGYYSQLADTLDTAIGLLSQAFSSELKVLHRDGVVELDPLSAFDTTAFQETMGELAGIAQQPATATSDSHTLVPDQQQVVESLRTQHEIYEGHVAAQQAYLDSGAAIETSVRAQEESRFETAQTVLEKAQKSLNDGIPDIENTHRLYNAGVSLKQYGTLLSLRQEGVSKLLGVSGKSVPTQQRQAAIDDALNRFFEARRIVTTQAAVWP